MEKIVIFKSDGRINQSITNAENIANTILAQLSEMFKSEGLHLNEGHFLNFMADKSIQQHVKGSFECPGYVGELLLGIARADVERAQIKSERMKHELIRNATEYPIEKFALVQKTIEEAMWKGGFELSDFTFKKDGRPVLSEKGRTRITQKYTATLDNAEEKEFWNLFSAFCLSLDKLGKHCENNGRKHFMSNIEVDPEWILRDKDGSIKPNPETWLKEKNDIN